MPRDAGGNYSLAAGNPVVAGTIIRPSWANPTMDDLAIAMTDSLSRSGKGGMLVPFLNVDGAVNLPGIAFTNEPSLGIFREGNNEMRAGVAATDSTRWIAGDFGFEIWSGTAWVKPNTPATNPIKISGVTAAIEFEETGGGLISTLIRTATGFIIRPDSLVSTFDLIFEDGLGQWDARGTWKFAGIVQFEVSPITFNNIPYQGWNTAMDTRVDLAKVSDGNVAIFGEIGISASMRAQTSFGIEIAGAVVGNFLGGTSGGLVMENNIPFQGKEVGGTVRKLAYIDVLDTVALGNPQTKMDIACLTPQRNFVSGVNPMNLTDTGAVFPLEVNFSADAVLANGFQLRGRNGADTGNIGLIHLQATDLIFIGASNAPNIQVHAQVDQKFFITQTEIFDIDSSGLNYADGARVFFRTSVGTPLTSFFLQNDNELRFGGTGMPLMSFRVEPLSAINYIVGTTISQIFEEDKIICRSKGVGDAATSHIQFQDTNGLNVGKLGVIASNSQLILQAQGGQDVRLEALAVKFNVVGTTAVAANVNFEGAERSIKLVTSSRKYKKDIVPIARAALDKVLEMSPIRYRSKSKGDDPNMEHYGLIAEEVHDIDPRLVCMVEGKPNGVQYDRVAVLLLGVVQDMAKRLKVLENA